MREDNSQEPGQSGLEADDAKGGAKVVAYVRGRIVAGELQRGGRLPPERELCNLIGVSRPMLREGLCALEVLGLVDIQHGRGTFISQPNLSVLSDALVLGMAQEVNAVEDILQARIAIECQAIRLACDSITDTELSDVKGKLEDFVDTFQDAEQGGTADYAFHSALVNASHSPSLITIYNVIAPLLLRSHIERRRVAIPSQENATFLLQAHKKIFEALVNGKADEAEQCMRDHFEISARLRRNRFLLEAAVENRSNNQKTSRKTVALKG